MFGSDENYKYGAGLRFSKRSSKGLVQVVNGDYATGGDTTIESGMGKFNIVKREMEIVTLAFKVMIYWR